MWLKELAYRLIPLACQTSHQLQPTALAISYLPNKNSLSIKYIYSNISTFLNFQKVNRIKLLNSVY